MRPITLPALVSRCIALGILGILMVGSLAIVVLPLIRAQGQLVEQETSLAHEHAVVSTLAAQLPDLQTNSDALDRFATTAGLLQAAGDANLTQAQAISAITQLASGAGLRVVSTEARTPEDEAGIRRLPILVRITGSDVAVASFFTQVKASKPLLIVQRLSLRTDISPGSGADAVQAEIVLEALIRKAG